MWYHFLRAGGVSFLIYIIIIAKPGSSLFSFHPVLMTFTFVAAMTEAMLIFSKNGLASRSLQSTRVTAHWLILSLVALTHGLGYAAIYYNKEINEKPHYVSWHGCVGLGASVLLWMQLCVGVFVKYPKLLQRFLEVKKIKANHAIFGTLTFTLGMSAMVLALWSSWFGTNASLLAFYSGIGLCVSMTATFVVKFVKKYAPVIAK